MPFAGTSRPFGESVSVRQSWVPGVLAVHSMPKNVPLVISFLSSGVPPEPMTTMDDEAVHWPGVAQLSPAS